MVTLATLLSTHRAVFAYQTWYTGEAFVARVLETPLRHVPTAVTPCPHAPTARRTRPLPWAVQLAELYTRTPAADVWRRFLWCADTDQWGQRIFVGGVGMTRGFAAAGFQIHRHVTLTEDWGIPRWD